MCDPSEVGLGPQAGQAARREARPAEAAQRLPGPSKSKLCVNEGLSSHPPRLISALTPARSFQDTHQTPRNSSWLQSQDLPPKRILSRAVQSFFLSNAGD